ncbi:hypothetical protein HDU67_006569 [Dinochytrium kinnereticum]|nr:hypothetical protein HDU67_006569 [Dinochytrium kinnereticum]
MTASHEDASPTTTTSNTPGWMVASASAHHDDIQLTDQHHSTLHRRQPVRTSTPIDAFSHDAERPAATPSVISSTSDHALLLAGKKSPEELKNLKKLGGRGKRLMRFYERQNELIEELINPHPVVDQDEADKLALKVKIALYGSTAVNILLFALQLIAAITSGSLSLFATMADSFMDLASSFVLLATGAAANRKNIHTYPTGKKRFETAGIIVFSCIMGALSIQLIIEAVRSLASKSREVDLTPLICKVGLYFYCVALSQFQTARILAQDHLNDIIFNAFGIGLVVLGNFVAWWIDPSGAIVIALLILKSWAGTAMEHIQMLVGKSADPAFLSKVTYIAMQHPEVLLVDTVRAYHSGEGFFCEVDIVLPPEMPLYRAHDIGEALQIKIEALGNVERAFVHLDYETTHKPEHKSE